MTSMLSSKRLENLTLDLQVRSISDPQPLLGIKKLFTKLDCTGLKRVSIQNASLHLKDIVELLSNRNEPFRELRLDGTHLLSGTWVQDLHVLKGKCPPGTDMWLAVVPHWADME
ncbi:hypothetical protein ONS96_006005 [Cadophora gregata f. sp. sojae]|nr:hypothetical protein ONS96_006005 [Cadophora gregata f. sp. sojae]